MSPNQWHLRYSSRELLTVHKCVYLTVWSVFRRSARNAVKVYRLRFAVHAASKSHPGVLKYCASQKKFIFNVLFSTVLKSLYVHVSNVYYICTCIMYPYGSVHNMCFVLSTAWDKGGEGAGLPSLFYPSLSVNLLLLVSLHSSRIIFLSISSIWRFLIFLSHTHLHLPFFSFFYSLSLSSIIALPMAPQFYL